MFEFLRKFSLLMALFIVGLGTHFSMQNTTDWRESLRVTVYPINGDGLDSTQRYIDEIETADFGSIEQFMRNEAERFGIDIKEPVRIVVGHEIFEQPPKPPRTANPFKIAYWSLKLRWWSNSITNDPPGADPDIRLFLVYFDPNVSPTLSHSLGLQKGLVGIVNVFSAVEQAETNNFVVAHELLHTLGATDKYGGPSNLPVFPVGYADPNKFPLYPQTQAEIMGGRVALSETQAEIPADLSQVIIGPSTAVELRWIE
jgi:hypothetical protein